MIVDFPSIKSKLDASLNIFLRREVKKNMTFFSTIGKHLIHEGKKHAYETMQHTRKDMDFKKAEVEFTVTKEERETITLEGVLQKVSKSAEEMAAQMERDMFATLHREIDEAGQSVDEKGKPFTHETLLKAMEMLDVDFKDDDRKQPQMPSLVMHPDMAKKVFEQDAKLSDEERKAFEARKEALLDKKYQEFLDREAHRKLVD